MRVLHIIIGLRRGGAERLLLDLCKQNTEDHSVLVISQIVDLLPEYSSNSIRVFKLFNPRDWAKIITMLMSRHTVFHGWMYHGNLFAQIVGIIFFKNKKTIISIHNQDIDRSLIWSTRWIAKLSGFLATICSVETIFVSSLSHACHKDHGYRGPKKIIMNGIDFSNLRPKPNTIRKKTGDLIIGVAARFDFHKGHDVFFNALQELNNREEKFEAFLCGKDIEYSNVPLAREIKTRGLEKKVRLLGEITAISEFYEQVDLVVVPSRFEAFGLVAVEAIAMKKPLVHSNIASLMEVAGDAGLWFETGDSMDLAKKLTWLLDSDNYQSALEKLDNQVMKSIHQKYDIKNTYLNYAKVWRQCVE